MKKLTSEKHRLLCRLIAFTILLSSTLINAAVNGKALTASDIDAELSKQTKDIHTINKTEYGAELKCPVQGVKAEVSKDEFKIISTKKEDNKASFSLRVNHYSKGENQISPETDSTQISVNKKLVTVSEKNLDQEFSTKYSGIRQDFIVKTKPSGNDRLSLRLDINGATAKESKKRSGVLLTLRNGHSFIYGDLLVNDKTGKQLPAKFNILSPSSIEIMVDDTDAQYPIRIDPTITDDNWFNMGYGIFGDDSQIYCVINDGVTIYIGGDFTKCGSSKNTRYLAQWTGAGGEWQSVGLGVNGPVYAMDMDDDGNLYVGGLFTRAGKTKVGDLEVNHVAKYGWDNDRKYTGWHPLSDGTDGPVYAIGVDRSGASGLQSVYVGGNFDSPGKNIAKWKIAASGPGSWETLKSGVSGWVSAITVDPDTQDCYIGGSFTAAWNTNSDSVAGTANLVKWRQVIPATDPITWEWASVGSSGSTVYALEYDNVNKVGGNTVIFYAAGTSVQRSTNLGGAWGAAGGGDPGIGGVRALAVDTANNILYAGGTEGVASSAAGGTGGWVDLALPLPGDPNPAGTAESIVYGIAVDSGGLVYTGGDFTKSYDNVNYIPELDVLANANANSTEARNIAVYDTGLADWFALQQVNDSDLPVGIAGAGPDYSNNVNAIASDCSGNVFIGGAFTQVINGDTLDPTVWVEQPARNIAHWNGTTWSPLDGGVNGEVGALQVIGTNLYVGGAFTTADYEDAMHIAKYNITNGTWSNIGEALTPNEQGSTPGYDAVEDIPLVVLAMAADSSGNLYVGGKFTSPGNYVAKWSGGSGSAMGSGVGVDEAEDATPFVYALACDSSGAVYIGGGFTSPYEYITKYDGSNYSDIGASVNRPVLALAADTERDMLYIGGDFTTSAAGAAYIIQYDIEKAAAGDYAWDDMNKAVDGPVYDITIDSSSQVYAVGDFSFADSNNTDDSENCNNIAYWNDSGYWQRLGSGIGNGESDQQIWAVSFSDVLGTLFTGGAFTKFKDPVETVNRVACCKVYYILTFDVCRADSPNHPYHTHDHEHGTLSPAQWVANADYLVGDQVLSSDNSYLLECIVAGESSGSEPDWQTLIAINPNNIVDGGVTWKLIASAGTPDQWAAATDYVVGDEILSTDRKYRLICIVAGQSAAIEPDWTTIDPVTKEITDGPITWKQLDLHNNMISSSSQNVAQYVFIGGDSNPITAIPYSKDFDGWEYFLSRWTGVTVPNKCGLAPCISPTEDNTITHTATTNATQYVAHFGRIIYVDDDADGENTGQNWANAFTDLQDAMDLARPYDMIWVAKGTYYPSSEGDRAASFTMKKFLRMYGGFAGTETLTWEELRDNTVIYEFLATREIAKNETILSGDITVDKSADNYTDDPSDNSYHIITGPGGDDVIEESIPSYLDGFTIEAGYANNSSEDQNKGAALFVRSIPLEVSYCTFRNNFANTGGAVYVEPTEGGVTDCSTAVLSIKFYNCAFANNNAINGGALATRNATVLLEYCTFGVNSATIGGACRFNGKGHTIDYSIFYQNVASDTGTDDNIALINGASVSVTYSNVEPPASVPGGVYPGDGNMSTDPYFVNTGSTATWSADTEYQQGDVILVGQIGRKFVCLTPVGTSDAATEPDWDTAPNIGNTITDNNITWQYQAWDNTVDVHLQSSGGHFTTEGWVYDSLTSPCIDATNVVIAANPAPYLLPTEWDDNGLIANMGAYGNTIEGSKTFDVSPNPAAEIVVTNPNSSNTGLQGLLYDGVTGRQYEIKVLSQGGANTTQTLSLGRTSTGIIGVIAVAAPDVTDLGNNRYLSTYTWNIDAGPALVSATDYYIHADDGGGNTDDGSEFTINTYGNTLTYQISVDSAETAPTPRLEDSDGNDLGDPVVRAGLLTGTTDDPVIANIDSGGPNYFVKWTWIDTDSGAPLGSSSDPEIELEVTGNITATAHFDTKHTLTVVNGDTLATIATYEVLEGQKQSITADTPGAGRQFDDPIWTEVGGGSFADDTAQTTNYTMPGNDATVTCNYVSTVQHLLTVNNGTPSGNVGEGALVTITAEDRSATHEHFTHWSWDTQGGSSVDDMNTSPATLTMGTADTEITANFVANASYSLNVIDGVATIDPGPAPGGLYYSTEAYQIVADVAPAGYYFDYWYTADGGSFADATLSTTDYTMPNNDVEVQAIFAKMPVLTVVNGTGSGAKMPEEVVAITGTGTGYFVKWTSSGGGTFADEYSENTTFTMPNSNSDITVTANYTSLPSLVVVNGTDNDGGPEHAAGTVVSITADSPPAGKYFSGWTANVGAVADPNSETTTYTMPDQSAVVTANYTDNPTLTVVDGTPASTSVLPGTVVTITADSDSTGSYFDYWSVSIGGGPEVSTGLADPNARTTTYTMTTDDTTATAHFSTMPNLIVVNGNGDGYYASGTDVNITGVAPVGGMHFYGWTTEDGGSFADASSESTTYTMPNNKATVTASYVWYLIYTAGANGIITGETSQQVVNGGDGTEVTAHANPGYKFDGWSDGVTTAARTDTAVAADINVTANFSVDPTIAGVLADGTAVDIDVSDVPGFADAQFSSRPKLMGTYSDPIKGNSKTSTTRGVTKISSSSKSTNYVSEWVKSLYLYDKNLLRDANKAGTSTDSWLNDNYIEAIPCTMSIKVRQENGSTKTTALTNPNYLIAPPLITDITGWDGNNIAQGVHLNSVIIVNGKYFGKKLPKCSIEYTDIKGNIKNARLKVLKVLEYDDSKGKVDKSCMNVTTGVSAIQVQMPKKWWTDWGTNASYLLILDNKMGIATIDVPTIPAGTNNAPVANTDTVSLSGNNSYLIDVLANDEDQEADSLTLTLSNDARRIKSSNNAKISVSKNQIKYIPAKDAAMPYTETFIYKIDDGHGGSDLGTVTVTVSR